MNRDFSKHAFSLVEVVLALGVVSFAVIAILGMFPVGFKNALESRRETRAAYLAEQIMADLRSAPFSRAAVQLPAVSGDAVENSSLLDLSQAGTLYLAGNVENAVLSEVSQADYTGGVSTADIEFLAKVAVDPHTGFSKLARVTVEISTPAAAALAQRTRYPFYTLIGEKP